MPKEIIEFYSSLRQIYGVCPSCEEIFRVSDCSLYQKQKPIADWKDKIDKEIDRLDLLEEKINDKINQAKEAARESGRKEADKLVKKIDPIFRPLRLNPNDAKVIFNPLDFIVFNGMNDRKENASLKGIVLLDNKKRRKEQLKIQKSIDKAVNSKSYEWLTITVNNDGSIDEE